MATQSLLVLSGLSGDAIGVLSSMVVPSGPTKLLHEQRKQSNVYMTKTLIEKARNHFDQTNATFFFSFCFMLLFSLYSLISASQLAVLE
jgi:hypothetical protein